MQNTILIILAALFGVGLVVYFVTTFPGTTTVTTPPAQPDASTEPPEASPATSTKAAATTSPAEAAASGEPRVTSIGTSADGNDIRAHLFGDGERRVLLVSGIHGGYAWNTVLLARQMVEYFTGNPEAVPDEVTLAIVPLLNPDGLAATVGTTDGFTAADVPSPLSATISGRFNGNSVDLNRNFDCEWQPEGVWRERTVDAGSAPFSEPEAAALRDFVAEFSPDAVVAYYAAAGGVFASNCRNGVMPETETLTNSYATAASYQAFEEYDFYEISGDMVNWLAKEEIPAISVLLSDHESVEFAKNRRGVAAVLQWAEAQ